MQYRFTVDYRSGMGAFTAGEIVDIDDDTAAWLLRDVAGCIEPVEPDDAPERQQTAQHDRQMKRAPRTR